MRTGGHTGHLPFLTSIQALRGWICSHAATIITDGPQVTGTEGQSSGPAQETSGQHICPLWASGTLLSWPQPADPEASLPVLPPIFTHSLLLSSRMAPTWALCWVLGTQGVLILLGDQP